VALARALSVPPENLLDIHGAGSDAARANDRILRQAAARDRQRLLASS
jgi:hypothetical protein